MHATIYSYNTDFIAKCRECACVCAHVNECTEISLSFSPMYKHSLFFCFGFFFWPIALSFLISFSYFLRIYRIFIFFLSVILSLCVPICKSLNRKEITGSIKDCIGNRIYFSNSLVFSLFVPFFLLRVCHIPYCLIDVKVCAVRAVVRLHLQLQLLMHYDLHLKQERIYLLYPRVYISILLSLFNSFTMLCACVFGPRFHHFGDFVVFFACCCYRC